MIGDNRQYPFRGLKPAASPKQGDNRYRGWRKHIRPKGRGV